MTDQQKGYLSASIILGCLALLGFLVHEKVESGPMAAISAVTLIIAWVTRPPDRKDPPSGVVVVAGTIFATIAMLACSSPGAIAAESAYTAEQLRCVDKADTLAESRACRQAVDARWGITHAVADGGAP